MIEISHRCPSCGVAVRDVDALFCPECGKPLSEQPTESNMVERSDPTTASPIAKLDDQHDAVADSSHPDSSVTAQSSLAAHPSTPEETPATVTPSSDEAAQPAHRRGEKTRERLHRASEVARGVTRGVIEEPAKRVEKIRHASTHVIEEASYDPSLRFVLVALGLFVVFIVLLVLSKVMG